MCIWVPGPSFCIVCLVLHTATCMSHPASTSTKPDESFYDQNSSYLGGKTNTSRTTHSHLHNDMQLSPPTSTEEDKTKQVYVQKLFHKYGVNGTIDYHAFIHLLENLGVKADILPKHSHVNHQNSKLHVGGGDSHQGPPSNASLATDQIHDDDHNHDDDHDHNHAQEAHDDHDDTSHGDHGAHLGTPLTSLSNTKLINIQTVVKEVFSSFHITETTLQDTNNFQAVCPAIVYVLDNLYSKGGNPSFTISLSDDHQHDHDNSDSHSHGKATNAAVWGYATLAIVIISLVGLLGVAVIPIMQKVFYNHLLQFLVAMAVGALSGDALLHLLPHALGADHTDHSKGHNHTEGEANHAGHQTTVLKGLCGLLGIYFFFLMERILTIITDLKRKRKKGKSIFVKSQDNKEETSIPLTQCGQIRADDADCNEQIMGIHPGQKALNNYAEFSQKTCLDDHHHHNNHQQHSKGANGHSHHDDDSGEDENPESVLSHSHHGHTHALPNSIAAIAWMVILGDGIHNLSDGLAIGAAFSNSITGGFSTTIAVFCHELPHEIGDFAVLLRAGMSIRQAMMYNCVSSLLAFIGVLIGVAIGNVGEASLWVFVCIAGMFLYIALVDMLPELMGVDTKKDEHPFMHLFLQMLGMVLGASIMFLIAWYEEDLMAVLD